MEQDKTLLKNNLSKKIDSCSFSKDQIYHLCKKLEEWSSSAGDLEVSNFEKLPNQSDESYEEDKRSLRSGFVFKLTLTGTDGKQLYGTIKEIFESPNFPENVISVYINSSIILRVLNWTPRNSFTLFLDFSKPSPFDFSILPSQSTPNESR